MGVGGGGWAGEGGGRLDGLSAEDARGISRVGVGGGGVGGGGGGGGGGGAITTNCARGVQWWWWCWCSQFDLAAWERKGKADWLGFTRARRADHHGGPVIGKDCTKSPFKHVITPSWRSSHTDSTQQRCPSWSSGRSSPWHTSTVRGSGRPWEIELSAWSNVVHPGPIPQSNCLSAAVTPCSMSAGSTSPSG